jgi:hypothetical protein
MTFQQIQCLKDGKSVKRVKEAYMDEFSKQDIAPYLRTHGRFPGDFPSGDMKQPQRSPSPSCSNQSQILLQKSLRDKMGFQVDKHGHVIDKKIKVIQMKF